MASVVKFPELARVVNELFPEHPTYPTQPERSPGFKIVKAVFKSIEQALKRGERVEVRGLGVFKLRRTPTFSQSVHFPTGKITRSTPRGCKQIQSSLYVIFVPAESILKTLNKETNVEPQAPLM